MEKSFSFKLEVTLSKSGGTKGGHDVAACCSVLEVMTKLRSGIF